MADVFNQCLGLIVVFGIPIGIILWVVHALSKED